MLLIVRIFRSQRSLSSTNKACPRRCFSHWPWIPVMPLCYTFISSYSEGRTDPHHPTRERLRVCVPFEYITMYGGYQFRIQDFPKEPLGAPTYYFTKFSRKLHENKEILVQKGEGASLAPPLDPPLVSNEWVTWWKFLKICFLVSGMKVSIIRPSRFLRKSAHSVNKSLRK